jgi:D-alanyl-D-alanine dipeptidase
MSPLRRITCPEDLFHPTADHPVETIANLDAVAVHDNGEPLVDLRFACPTLLFAEKRLFARQSVAERLNIAQMWLTHHHAPCRLWIREAYRDTVRQQRYHLLARRIARLMHPFWSREMIRELANKYVAAHDAFSPPPHATGGAIDVNLYLTPILVAPMGTRSFPAAHRDYPLVTPEERGHRMVLRNAMEYAGFSNYEEEWWHWSYGDSGWALRTHQPTAFYDRVPPPR